MKKSILNDPVSDGEMKEVNNNNNFSFLSGLDADFILLFASVTGGWLLAFMNWLKVQCVIFSNNMLSMGRLHLSLKFKIINIVGQMEYSRLLLTIGPFMLSGLCEQILNVCLRYTE